MPCTSRPRRWLRAGPASVRLAPEWVGITRWSNSPPLSLAGLRGQVVLADFWTHGCSNCINILPHVQAWHNACWPALYLIDRQGRVIYQHMGEGAYELTEARIRQALQQR